MVDVRSSEQRRIESASPSSRERIVDTARRLFIESGYLGVSMQQIADITGLRKASLYHHFRSKDSLFADVMAELMDRLLREFEAVDLEDIPVEEQLRQIALINSMTKKERANPDLLQASRKKRIAAGAGLEVSELNKLLKVQRQMADTMKKLGGMKGGMLKQALRAMTGRGGGLPDMAEVDPAKMAEATRMLQDPKGLGGQLGQAGLPGGLSGLFGKK